MVFSLPVNSTHTLMNQMNTDTDGPIEHVTGLWYSESITVILQAGTKQFRLPSCILAARSPVFRDLLSKAKLIPLDGSDVGKGPQFGVMYRLLDAPQQVESFLRAVYDTGYVQSYLTYNSLQPHHGQHLGILSHPQAALNWTQFLAF